MNIFMNDNFESSKQHIKDEFGCSTVGYQDVDVCVPITIKAFGEVGNAKRNALAKASFHT